MMPSSPGGKVHTRCAKFPARVLIIDDEPLVCWSLAAGLRLAGFEAVTAASGAEALTLARQRVHPDVALLDSRLYNSDLASLLRELRLAAPACRVLMMTTAGPEMSSLSWDSIGVVRKPFDLTDVVRLVNAAMAPTPLPSGGTQ